MEIKKRLFPYPVLCIENDDYIDCEFNVNVQQTEALNDIILHFEISLNNKELLKEIRNGNAEFIIHIECSCTSYRKVVRNVGNRFEFRIPKSKVNKEIYLVGMIVATKTIYNFFTPNFNEDYEGDSVSFEKGSILAYRNLPRIIVLKNYEELLGDNAFFTIVSRHNDGEDEPVTYEISGSKIKIYVDKSIYSEYIKFHTNSMMKPIMISLLVMPALSYAIEEIRKNDIDNYISCFWYQQIKKTYKLQGKDFVEDVIDSDATSIEIAQELLQLPIGKAFRSLSAVMEE